MPRAEAGNEPDQHQKADQRTNGHMDAQALDFRGLGIHDFCQVERTKSKRSKDDEGNQSMQGSQHRVKSRDQGV
jgi:hypothetical protein